MEKRNKSLEELLEEALVPVDVQPYKVHENWVWCKLGSIINVSSGKGLTKNNMNIESSIPVYGGNGITGFHDEFNVVDPSIIVGRVGANCGNVHITEKQAWITDNAFIVSYDRNKINKLFLFQLLKFMELGQYSKSSAQPVISGQKIYPVPIQIPPFKEQQRIVKKIESLFFQIDKAKELIEEAREGFENRKSSILAKAFRGELTKKWRQENIHVESAEVLLEQVKEDRVNRYQDECDKAEKTKRRKPKKPRFMSDKSYDTVGNNIPSSWKECYIYEFADVTIGGTPSRSNNEYWNGNIHWISSGEVANNIIFDSEEKITEEGLENSNTKIYPKGTILIAMIGEGKTRGQSSILGIEACTNQNVAGVLFDDKKIMSKYIWYNFIFNYNKNRNVGRGGNQPALNSQKVGELTIALAPLEEQKEIVRILDKLLEEESKIYESTQLEDQIELLKKSILSKAFRGELGTNDPTEESAIELLKEVLKENIN